MGSGYQGQAMPGEGERRLEKGTGRQPGEEAAMPPASILSPGLDGKASPSHHSPRSRKPNPPSLGNAVRGWGAEAGAGYRSEGRVCHSPPQRRHCHPAPPLLQIGVALPGGCQAAPSRPGDLPLGVQEGVPAQTAGPGGLAAAQETDHLRSDRRRGTGLGAAFLPRREDFKLLPKLPPK